MRHQIGLAILEVLVALSIAMPLLSILVLGLHHCANALILAAAQHQRTLDVARASTMLQWVMDDLDSHRFPVYPRIHRNGFITFSDGMPSPLTLSAAHKPSDDSDAVTGLKLSIENTLTIRSNTIVGTSLRLFACPRFGSKVSSELSCLIGLHSLGFVELETSKVSRPNKDGCRTLNVNFGKSMSVNSADALSAQAITMLIPIERHYTLYVDQDHQLRYVSHCAERLIENQPALSNIKTLRLSLDAVSQLPVFQLSADLTLGQGSPVHLAGMNHLARGGLFNFLLNRP